MCSLFLNLCLDDIRKSCQVLSSSHVLKLRWIAVQVIWRQHKFCDFVELLWGLFHKALYFAVLLCFISGLSAEFYHVSMAINHFSGPGAAQYIITAPSQKAGGRREQHSICRAWLRTLERRLSTGYQMWTQDKSLSSSFLSHSFSATLLWAAHITRSNLQWIAESVKAVAANPDAHSSTLTKFWNRS